MMYCVCVCARVRARLCVGVCVRVCADQVYTDKIFAFLSYIYMMLSVLEFKSLFLNSGVWI